MLCTAEAGFARLPAACGGQAGEARVGAGRGRPRPAGVPGPPAGRCNPPPRRSSPASPPPPAAGGLRPALPLFQSLLCHTAVEPQGRGQPVAVTGSPISEEKVVPFPAKRRLTVVFRIYSITLGLKPVV